MAEAQMAFPDHHSPLKRFESREALIAICMGIGLFLAVFWCIQTELFPTERDTSFRNLLKSLESRQSNVLELARRYRQANPNDVYGIWFVAEAAAKQGDHQAAVLAYQQLPRDEGQWEFQRSIGLGRRFFSLGELDDAERSLQRAVELNPYHLEANDRLGHLMQICGRVWESAPHFFTQIQRGKCRGDELLGAAVTDRFFRQDERLTRMSQSPGSHALPIRLAEARELIYENNEFEAEKLLRVILATHPNLGEAHGRLGRIIVDRGDLSEFLLWRGGMPDSARRHPEVLFVEGLKARQLGQIEGAAHCFLQVLQRSPNHLGANLQISGCLGLLGRKEIAGTFSKRATLLADVDQKYNLLRTNFEEQATFDTIELLGKLGRFWEAAGWSFVLTNLDNPSERSKRELARWLAKIGNHEASQNTLEMPHDRLRLTEFQPPKWPSISVAESTLGDDGRDSVAWKFSDDSLRTGIDFEFYDGTTFDNRLTHIFNSTGGGVGAIDYDGDGWVDLYLAQGNDWRDPSPQPAMKDRLYRSSAGERFVDVTSSSGVNEIAFSQGVAVGDYNQDGFADLYVGNIGPNTLFCNNGDGTFAESTHDAAVGGEEWSTSSVFADFTGDGLPDLYVLNYALLKETAARECKTASGRIVACTPDLLTAEHDRCYVNLGDGRFRDVSEEAGIRVPDGRGLGVIAWDFTGEGRLSLFVANDTSANFLFLNRGSQTDGIPGFTEAGLLSGVAFDNDGNAQATMGVAAGDANGDGRLDLHVTNFFADSNTLYLAGEGGYFTDETRKFRLREPSFWMLGFGTQFADFDGDGWQDLVVTNGHVDQVSSTGTGDQMVSQVYQNVRGHHFVEVSSERLGSFFQQKRLGRALAVLDWNRDGRMDFAVTHIHSPFALVTNQTPSRGRPLAVRLAGRRGSREAIGATLIAKVRGKAIYRFIVAGDGYLVSNERVTHFSWPGVEQFDELTVRWPDLHEQTWNNVLCGQEILLIEDREDPIIMHQFDRNSADELNSPNHP